MFLVFLKVTTHFLAEEALLMVFLEDSRRLCHFGTNLDDGMWVVVLRLDVLVERIERGEGFPE